MGRSTADASARHLSQLRGVRHVDGEAGDGGIVDISSVTVMGAAPFHSYAPAKTTIISLTACLAAEWGRAGVQVNCVSPGLTRTARVERRLELGERDPHVYDNSAMGRMVELNELADA